MRTLARWCYNHRRLVLLAWLALAIGATVIENTAGSNYNASFVLKGSQSTHAATLLRRGAPRAAGAVNQIVIQTRSGKVTDPAVRQSVSAMLANVATIAHVGSVASPYVPGAAKQVSRDGTVEYATVTFDQEGDKVPLSDVKRVVTVANSAASPTVNVQLGGQAIARTNPGGTGGLPVGMAAALMVLLLVFGSMLAAALPLIVAGLALATGVAAMGLLSHIISMPDFSSQLALLIGLGVGVDYALFIVTRYRQALMRGVSSENAIVQALDTSGRAVLFAGLTVGIALLGMLALGVSLLSGAGIDSSIVVAFTVLASLTLLPALLGFFGPRTLTRRARRALAAGQLRTNDESPLWARWAAILQRRPGAFAAAAAALMLLIAVPSLSMRVGSADAGSDPASTTTRQAYDLLAKGFGPGFNGRSNSSPTSAVPAKVGSSVRCRSP